MFPDSNASDLTPNPNQPAVPPARGPGFVRDTRAEAWIAILLVAYGAILMATNPWFTQVDEECAIIDVAARPILQPANRFLSGGEQHEHPPLSDLLLHGWLRLTNGNIHLLRLPSVIFYILGAWCLLQAARRLAGDRAGNRTLILILLWPFGFHMGRLTGW